MKARNLFIVFLIVLGTCLSSIQALIEFSEERLNSLVSKRWSVDQGKAWQVKYGYRAGMNFIPSTADNELEMFQAETYDPKTIDRELGFAQALGFSTARVFLHNLLWEEDSVKFLARLDNFLSIADKRGFSIMFVLLDSCWNDNPQPGTQPEPITGKHNSQWVQAPGYATIMDHDKFSQLKSYVMGVVTHYKDDSRIMAWDIWNEPNNSGYADNVILPLITEAFSWVRAVNPSQPLTTPVWQFSAHFSYFEQAQMKLSDVVSFHNYEVPQALQQVILHLKEYNDERPLVCTEYMARTAGSHFEPSLQIMKDENIYAYNWGLVNGRTMTIYDWSTTYMPATEPPQVWFHDVFNPDGTAFNQTEISYIQSVLLAKKN